MTDKHVAAILHSRLVAVALALLLVAGTAAAQQQGQQGGFSPNQPPSQQQPQPQEPEPAPAPGPRQVPYLAELEEEQGLDRRVATTGGLIWRCEGDTCRAEGSTPRDRRQTARICGDLARRLGAIARFEIAGAPVQRRALDECNRAARFAGQAPVPEPDVPGGRQGGFVPVPEGSELPEGVEPAEADDNRLTIVAPEGRGDGTTSIEVPDGGEATVEFTLADPANEDGTAGILLLVSEAPFVGDCAGSDWTGDESRGFVAGVPGGSTPLDLSGPDLRPGPTYYVRGCPVTGDGDPISGPPTNTVELAVLATVAPGGIATELPGANVLTVNGEGARAELLLPRYGRIREADLPTFSFNLGHSDSEDAVAAVLQVQQTPYGDGDECPSTYEPERRLGPPVYKYYAGKSGSDLPLDLLVDLPAYETHYVRVCPVVYTGPSEEYEVVTDPPTNVVEVVYEPGPDVEIVSVEPEGPPGRGGTDALYGHAYILRMTLRNNDAERAAEVLPAYSLNLDSPPFYKARFNLGLGGDGGDGSVELDPGETKTVDVFVDFRPESLTSEHKTWIRDSTSTLVQFFLARPDAEGEPGDHWAYEDANIGNHTDVLVDLDVRRRFEVEVRIPWVKMHGTCEILRSHPETVVLASLWHNEERSWKDHAHVNFSRGPLGQEKPVDYRFVLSDAEPGWEIEVGVLLLRRGSGSTRARIGYEASWSEWRDGVETEPRNHDTSDCPLGSMGAKVNIDTRMLPIE